MYKPTHEESMILLLHMLLYSSFKSMCGTDALIKVKESKMASHLLHQEEYLHPDLQLCCLLAGMLFPCQGIKRLPQ